MGTTKRYDYVIRATRKNYTFHEIIRHLVDKDKEGPISAYDIFRRADQLRTVADETQVASAVQAVLVNYHWLDDELDESIAQKDVEQALGLPMSLGRKHDKRG